MWCSIQPTSFGFTAKRVAQKREMPYVLGGNENGIQKSNVCG